METTVLTPAEFATRMKAIGNGDPEICHGDADELMCDLLTSLGYGEGVETFKYMEKWYA